MGVRESDRRSANGVKPKGALAWAFYDWANSAFATTILAGLFPPFFKDFWNGSSVGDDVATFRLATAAAISAAVVALLGPVLGAVADAGVARKRFLLVFMLLGSVMTACLCLVPEGAWGVAAAVYILASIGFAGSNIFYDSFLVDVARPGERDRVSALGYALGYLGGGLLFAGNVAMVLHPDWFGLAGKTQAVLLSFGSVSVWWALFSIPLLRGVHEVGEPQQVESSLLTEGFRRLGRTFREIRLNRNIFLFLLAYWLYIDGVHTIIRMATSYGRSLNFPLESLIVALLITQFVGFPAALLFGWLGNRFGARKGIFAGIVVYIGLTVWAYFMTSIEEFYALAVIVGLVQGGVQALSRSFFSRLIPEERAGEYFGFYNCLGRFAAILGPLLMGTVGLVTGSQRYAILSIVVLFVGGGILLLRVRET